MGYGKSPWTFTGRALYQLQLVKSDEAKKYIPDDLRIVELFGYTLGGIYLARYDDSPVGAFDECVVMAGLVWNPPTSCAWAARVFVSNRAARDHGIRSVGLPSRLASFITHSSSSKVSSSTSTNSSSSSGSGSWWWMPSDPQRGTRPRSSSSSSRSSSSGVGGDAEVVELRNIQPGRQGLPDRPVTLLRLPAAAAGFLGLQMRLSLPSFSGGTPDCPSLLQYSCDLQTNVMPVAPMQVEVSGAGHPQQQHQHQRQQVDTATPSRKQHPEVLDVLLHGKPLVCLAFSNMQMKVEEPKRLVLPAAQLTAHHSTAAAQPAFATLVPGAAGSSGRLPPS